MSVSIKHSRQSNSLLTVKVDNVACQCNHAGGLENLGGVTCGVAHRDYNLFGSNETNSQLWANL
jgi:hypothetical protein